jgi:hypothetical protein
MLHCLKDLNGFTLAAQDGEIGTLREAYFDDAHWVLRHLVVETGGWLSGRRVLVSPHAVSGVDSGHRQLQVALTRQQVEQAPSIDSDKPVSRQHEAEMYDFYGYPYYWGGSSLWGMMDMPMGGAIAPFTPPFTAPRGPGEARAAGIDDVAGAAGVGDARGAAAESSRHSADRLRAAQDAGDPHLRSSDEVTGYDIQARDGSIGHVADFLFDADTWRIVMLVVDTHNWLPDRLVLVPPHAVTSVDWSARQAVVNLTQQAVKDCPPYLRDKPVTQDQVMAAQRHFESMV